MVKKFQVGISLRLLLLVFHSNKFSRGLHSRKLGGPKLPLMKTKGMQMTANFGPVKKISCYIPSNKSGCEEGSLHRIKIHVGRKKR